MKLVKDERGQWIISAGFLVSVSIVILVLLLNQAMMGGYQSSCAILEFPKHEIRELVQETHREVNIAAARANEEADITAINSTFRKIILNYSNSVEYLYAAHGQMVYMNISSLDFNPATKKIEEVTVTILFSDGVTTCTFDPEIIEITIIEITSVSEQTETLYAENLSSACPITNETNAYGASDDAVAAVSGVGDNDTVDATIENHSVGSGTISSVKFKIRLRKGAGWKNDKIDISYSPDTGSNWYTVATSEQPGNLLTWYGNYTATNVDTWEKVDNMMIRITGNKQGGEDNGDLDIDAYHVYVDYVD